ncbi:hypothetical protein M569_12419 [Genlisea aurea]|uniref:Uncharacterized protein n=1 Tax=Genlisea aurea TaxID=192259 RepID=S8DRG8_9LAMI|nr:hypothetical protein M569_12419 [Genlisea aurea]
MAKSLIVYLCLALFLSSFSSEAYGRGIALESDEICSFSYPQDCSRVGISVCTRCSDLVGWVGVKCDTSRPVVPQCVCYYKCH